MNILQTDRGPRLAIALAEELAVVVGALLNGEAAARAVPGTACGGGWILRWRLAGAFEGELVAAIDENVAREFVRQLSGAGQPFTDATVAGSLAEMAGQVATGLNRNPAVEGTTVSPDGPPRVDALEPDPAAVCFEIAIPGGFQIAVTCRARLTAAPEGVAWEGSMPEAGARGAATPTNLGVILDIELPLVVRFAQASLTRQALSRLGPGSVIDLDRSPEDVVDVLVNGRTIARGEVVVTAGNYGVRITEVLNADERIRTIAS